MSKYQSWLGQLFERFVTLKKSGGYLFKTQANLLADFDRYLCNNVPAKPLLEKNILDYLQSLERLSPRGRDNIIDVVWQALAFAQRHGASITALPPHPKRAPSNYRLRPPRIISHAEIYAVIAAARRLPPSHYLCPATYATLFGLLFATGMRIGESLALNVGDINVNAGILTIQRGKFDKTRVLPLKVSTATALKNYINDSRRPIGKTASEPLFVSKKKRRLSYPAALSTLGVLCMAAALEMPHPRLHDIRHSFAVSCVVKWYQTNRDVNELLPKLSTYLGHISMENTRAYLQANGLLLEEANRRFSIKSAQLDKVLS